LQKVFELIRQGAVVGFDPGRLRTTGSKAMQALLRTVWQQSKPLPGGKRQYGKGTWYAGQYTAPDFLPAGIARDLMVSEGEALQAEDIAWTHRRDAGTAIYFISNQQATSRLLTVSVRVSGRQPMLYDPLTGDTIPVRTWRSHNGRTTLPIRLEASGSIFLLLQDTVQQALASNGNNWYLPRVVQTLDNPWQVQFDTAYGGPARPVQADTLTAWNQSADSAIRYYSGTAVYSTTFEWNAAALRRTWLQFDSVYNLATVQVNGVDCGTAWTYPYRVDISKALVAGTNRVSIAVSNTWANRLIGDSRLPEPQRITFTNAPFRLQGKPLLPAGLTGRVYLAQ
jgi:hypothetical protein